MPYRPTGTQVRECAYCGAEFTSVHKVQRYCTKKCSDRFRNRKRRRKQGIVPIEEYREKQKPTSKKVKLEYLAQLKREGSCADCPESDPVVLDFHHIRGVKVARLARMAKESEYTIDDLKQEVSKCVLVCANCHRRRHAKDT